MVDFEFENKIRQIKNLIDALEESRAKAVTYDLENDKEKVDYQIKITVILKKKLRELIK